MRVLLLGATGAAGGALLDAALADGRVSEVRVITRRPLPERSPKLQVVQLEDFDRLADVAASFAGIDACFYCIGRATTQVPDDAEYRHLAVDLPLSAATLLHEHSPKAVFHYLSGRGAAADSRQRWARAKHAAEQQLRGQFGAVCWRPGAIDARRQGGWPWHYRVFIPMLRWLPALQSYYVSGADLAHAMLVAAMAGSRDRIYENREIRQLAQRK